MEGLLQVRLAHLESVWCALSHPKAWENMAQDHFYPFQAHIQGSRGPKMAISMAKTTPRWLGCHNMFI